MTADATQSSAAHTSLRAALAPVTALLLGTAILYLGFGLQVTLVPLRAEAEDFSRLTVGLLGATYYAGFVAGCFFGPYLIMRAGHIRAFAAMVSCVSAAVLAFPLLVGELSWVLFRFAVGACIAGVLVAIESWLNEKSTIATRGAVMSAYVIITYGALTVGQLGVTVAPLDGFTLFTICSILLSLAAVPVALTRTTQPAPVPAVRFRPVHLWQLAPAGFTGAFISGVAIGSVLSLSAVFAVESGFDTSQAALFASMIVLGGALGQYPFGRTSDFVDRRIVLFIAAAGSGTMALFLMAAPAFGITVTLVAGFVFGFAALPMYAIAAAHAYDWTEYEDMVETSAGMNLLFGVGSTIGPILGSVTALMFGAPGLFLTIAVATFSLCAFLALRILLRRRPSEEQRSDFDLYTTAPVGALPSEDDFDELPDEDADEDGATAGDRGDNGQHSPAARITPNQVDKTAPDKDM